MKGHPDGYISIDAAAARLSRHRRTIHRLLEAGVLESITDPFDRRRTLISEDSLERFVNGISSAATSIATAHDTRGQELAEDIDALLASLKEYQQALAVALDAPTDQPRSSTLGRALHTLRLAVTGVQENRDDLVDALQTIHDTLFPPSIFPAGAPDAFITSTPVGQLLAEAQLRLERPGDWVSVNAIMERTGRPRSWVENALRVHGAPRLYDPRANRWLFPATIIRDLSETERA
jgi:hypothetical protein